MTRTSAIWLFAAVAACTDSPEPLEEEQLPEEKVIRSVEVLDHDCTGSGPREDQVDSFVPGKSNLHIIGLGQATYVNSWMVDPECQACLDDWTTCEVDVSIACDGFEQRPEPAAVHVGRGVTTLVLASPLATDWTVTVDPDAQLQTVIVSGIAGANDSTAVVPEGIAVEKRSLGYAYLHHDAKDLARSCVEELRDAALCAQLGDFWYEHRLWEASETDAFLAGVEQQLGEIGSFRGCHLMSSMTIGAPRSRGGDEELAGPPAPHPPARGVPSLSSLTLSKSR